MGWGPGWEAALESPPGRCQEPPPPTNPMDRRLRTDDNTDPLLPTPTTCTGGGLNEGLGGSGQRPRGWTCWGAWETRCRRGDSLQLPQPLTSGRTQTCPAPAVLRPLSLGQPRLTQRPVIPTVLQALPAPTLPSSLHPHLRTHSISPSCSKDQAPPPPRGWTDGCTDGQSDRRLTFAKS